MNCTVMTGSHHSPPPSDGAPTPRAPRTALVVHIVATVLALLAGIASVALAGGSLVDGRDDGPGFRAEHAVAARPPI